MKPEPGTHPLVMGPLSVVLRVRPVVAGLALACGLIASACLAVAIGNGQTVGLTAIEALFGGGSPTATQIVHVLRLPRFAAGAAAGIGLGIAGCLIQTLARNRLATPDLVGVTDGATVGIILAAVGSTAGAIGAWWAGPTGAMVAAAFVVLLAGGLGTGGYRVLVVGIGLSVTIDALTQLTLARQDVDAARGLFTWTLGYLGGRDYDVALPVSIGLAVLLPVALLASRRLRLLRFGDDTAATLGQTPRRVRGIALVIAVCLAGLSVGVGGPLAFVAMIAPVLAGRLARDSPVPVVTAGLLGGILVTVADTIGRAAGQVEIPAGVITGILGGPFLLWILLSRKV